MVIGSRGWRGRGALSWRSAVDCDRDLDPNARRRVNGGRIVSVSGLASSGGQKPKQNDLCSNAKSTDGGRRKAAIRKGSYLDKRRACGGIVTCEQATDGIENVLSHWVTRRASEILTERDARLWIEAATRLSRLCT